jgi:dihydrofolate reductase
MWNLMSLDGYFEGARPWALDWHETASGKEMEALSIEQLDGASALVFGRRTYEGMADHWSSAEGPVADRMNAIDKVVFSRTLPSADWRNTRLERQAATEMVRAMKEEEEEDGGDILVFGSADLSASLIAAGLFDEYRIAIAPVILGAGQPLFGRGLDPRRLRLLGSRSLATGAVVLRYEPSPE